MKNRKLIDKMIILIGNEELSSAQIIHRLKENGYNKRGYSFTSQQISVILSKNNNLERTNKKGKLATWRNRYVR